MSPTASTGERKRLPGRAQSLWLAERPRPSFPALEKDLHIDVAIVGAGITGLSAGVMLAEAGKRVAIVDQSQVAGGETGHTTGHLTEMVDTRYNTLRSRFGKDGAQLVAESSREAIAFCEERVRKHRIRCGFTRLPAFLYTEDPADVADLYEEMACMTAVGCRAGWTNSVPIPFPTAGGIWIQDQAQMDAYGYCLGLAGAFMQAGGQVFESIRVTGVQEGEPCVVETANGVTLRASAVIVAGHVPINNRVLLHTKLAAYRSYVLAAPVETALAGIFYDTADPYHYLRTHTLEQATYFIAGGEDHRTGAPEEAEDPFFRLEGYLKKRLGTARVKYRWSGQIIEPVDGLPYIGRNSLQSQVYVATGYAGNGITFGTLAGLILSDLILARPNRYAEVYAATRLAAISSVGTYIRENVAFPATLAADRLTNADVDEGPVGGVARGEGKILVVDGAKTAVSRDEHGRLQGVSAVCTHLGCDVRWNDSEKTWDCPCHGSRFSRDGRVLNGPAVAPLKPVDLTSAAIKS